MAFASFQARVHDESLRYVISDQAIVALADKAPTNHADKAPTNPADILTTIAEADSNADSSFSSGLSSPSPVVYSHLDDFRHLLHNKIGNPDNFFSKILQNCLGPNGSCPLSIFNYALLVECNMKVPLTSRKNGLRNSKQVARKSSRQLFVQKFSCKAPVYHNCRIYADDGRLLCYCDRRKLEWLGIISQKKHFTIKCVEFDSQCCILTGIFGGIWQNLLMKIHLRLCFFLSPKAVQKMKAMIFTFKVRKIYVLAVAKEIITYATE